MKSFLLCLFVALQLIGCKSLNEHQLTPSYNDHNSPKFLLIQNGNVTDFSGGISLEENNRVSINISLTTTKNDQFHIAKLEKNHDISLDRPPISIYELDGITYTMQVYWINIDRKDIENVKKKGFQVKLIGDHDNVVFIIPKSYIDYILKK